MPLSTTELLIIAAIVLLIFGGAWLPKLARRAGQSVKATEQVRDQLGQAQRQYAKVDRMTRKATRVANTASRVLP
jgi:TatA/E family protein of Tat protein translocase